MAHPEPFTTMLTGGHPNSLGRTVEVVDLILADASLLAELYLCYFSDDEVVRLRTSSAMKRVGREHPDWLIPYVDRFLYEISQINQASTQWTLAQLFLELDSRLTPDQRQNATRVLQKNLETSNDWIVIIQTLQTLAYWAKTNEDLKVWLEPHLMRLTQDSRKSVAKNADKLYLSLFGAK